MNKNVVLMVIAILVVLAGLLYGIPKYQVWKQGLKGQAELARAEQNRKIAVQEVEVKKDFAKALAENQQDVIYVPTEAGLPIREAGHRK